MSVRPPKTNAEIRGWYLVEIATVPELKRTMGKRWIYIGYQSEDGVEI